MCSSYGTVSSSMMMCFVASDTSTASGLRVVLKLELQPLECSAWPLSSFNEAEIQQKFTYPISRKLKIFSKLQ